MRSLIIKISVAIGIIAAGISSIFLINKYATPNAQQEDNPTESTEGATDTVVPTDDYIIDVNILITDISGNVLHNDHIEGKDKTLIELLDQNYTVRYVREGIGTFLYDIEEVKTDKWTTFIGIYVNDEFSNYGIDYIKLYDGIKIEFRESKVLW